MTPNVPHPETIDWNDDGTPVIPKAATWHGRIDLEHVIEVTE